MSGAAGGAAGSAGAAGGSSGSGGGSALQNLAKIASRYQGTGDADPTPQHSPQKKQRVTPAVSDLSSQKSASTNLTATQLAGTLNGIT